jgi:hypothetical protein
MNLNFDFFRLHDRWEKIGIDVPLKTLFYEHPYIDIKSILVIFNKGSFKGASLENIIGKKYDRDKIPEWYAKKDYVMIENYIRDEANGFVRFYQKLKEKIPIALKNATSSFSKS